MKQIQRNLLIQKTILVVKKYNNGELPHGFFKDTADIFGISRERVRQIAKKIKVSQRSSKKYFCRNCNKEILRKSSGRKIYCTYNCSKIWRQKQLQEYICKICGKNLYTKVMVAINND